MQNSPLKIEIRCSENAYFALRNCNGALKQTTRILRSENGNSAFKKWNFPTQKWKWKISPMPWKVGYSMIFRAKSVHSTHFCAAAIKSKFYANVRDRGILEGLVIIITGTTGII